MILGFKTVIDGKETRFREKILRGLFIHKLVTPGAMNATILNAKRKGVVYPYLDQFVPKLHSIRQDATDRWKSGRMIHFSTGVRTNGYLCFAPLIPVISTQKIEIISEPPNPHTLDHPRIYLKKIDEKTGKEMLLCFSVRIDNRYQWEDEIKKLAKNDGFETVDEFFAWFGSGWKGKIIHWTNFRYR